MKKIAAYIIGPIVWLAMYLLMVVIATIFWDVSTERYAGMALVAFLGSSLGCICSVMAMKALHHELSPIKAHVYLGICVLLWVGSSVVVAPDSTLQTLRLISLGAALLAIFISSRYERD